jgi:hypothetical protein
MTNFIHKSIGNKGESVKNAERHAESASRSKSGVLTTLANLLRGPGSGVRSHRRFVVPFALLVLMLALGGTAGTASAAQVHPFKEIFGGAAQPSFGNPEGLAIDKASGDLLVIDAGAGTVSRYDPDGSPADFSALGTNVIDGAGTGDETPQGGLTFGGAAEVQVAVDSSGGATNGDIYVTQGSGNLIDIFAPTGAYLGQLTESSAGPFAEACGVAVDPSGSVYVSSYTAGRVDKFVPSANPPRNSDSTINFSTGSPCTLAAGVGPSAGFVFAAQYSGPVSKFDSATGALEYVVAEGANMTVGVDSASGALDVAAGNEVIEYDASGASGATVSSKLTAAGTVQGVAVDPGTGNVYISRAGSSEIEVFGPAATLADVLVKPASDVTPTKATLNGTVNPDGVAVSNCQFEYLTQAEYEANGNSYEGANSPLTQACEGSVPTDSTDHPVTAKVTGLVANGTTYHFRVSATNANGTSSSADQTFISGDAVVTKGATAIGATEATVNGVVFPEGLAVTGCKFEYGTTTAYENSEPCVGAIPPDAAEHAVSADVSGLAGNTIYHFRIIADVDGSPVTGGDESFETLGPPRIVEEFAANVGKTSAALQAEVNPSGFPTTYYFEWGTDSSYGHRVPLDEAPTIGSGTAPVTVSAEISGLQEASVYHFRVTAAHGSETIHGPDHEFWTLDSEGLPDNRRFELVSPSDKRPQGAAREKLENSFVAFQAAENGDSTIFPYLGALESDSGGDASYLAQRSATGWESTKVSPPSLVPNPSPGLIGTASPGIVEYYSPDLSCGVVATFNPLTKDTPPADVELGITNLYRRDSAGAYTLITNLVPSNPGIEPRQGEFVHGKVVGASADCSRIYFYSEYKYLPGASGLYEWDEGTLRDAGELPNGEIAPAEDHFGYLGLGAGGENSTSGATGRRFAVSPDGSSFFFNALSNSSETFGEQQLFVREDGNTVVEASHPQGGTEESLGARYQGASSDGSHVFFTANYGLTADSSNGPEEGCGNVESRAIAACDLYDFDVDSGQLADLSADPNPADPKGASVGGVAAVSKDGSSVYFAARGQLVPEKGKTYDENVVGGDGAGSLNLYLSRGGHLSFVGEVLATDMQNVVIGRGGQQNSETTPSGDHLVFQSSADVTSYVSDGHRQVYLYSAQTGRTVCISCKPDGLPSVGEGGTLVSTFPEGPSHQSSIQVMSDDGNRVFFRSQDVLAAGAISEELKPFGRQNNLYEWENGQVYFLATGAPPLGLGISAYSTEIYGASASGDDLFIHSPERLDPHDTDSVMDVYDLRVGGGFPPPLSPPAPCDPAADQCQGTATSPPAAAESATSGPVVPAGMPRCKKKKVLRHGKCVPKKQHRGAKKQHKKASHKKRHKKALHKHHKKAHGRAANTDRGGSK